jgi:hypothetical protein
VKRSEEVGARGEVALARDRVHTVEQLRLIHSVVGVVWKVLKALAGGGMIHARAGRTKVAACTAPLRSSTEPFGKIVVRL